MIDHEKNKPATNYSQGCRCDDCREGAVAEQKKYREHNRKTVAEAKDAPCLDCGESYPPGVMELVRGAKKLTWGSVDSMGMKRLKTEVAKHDALCANCYRLRT